MEQRQSTRKAFDQGNYKDAYEAYRKLVLDPQTDPAEVGQDLDMATDCLRRLNRVDELDALWEEAAQAGANNWQLLFAVARNYFRNDHIGYIVAGKFHRGYPRGAGYIVNPSERDRARALQLMTAAMEKTQNERDVSALSSFYLEFANMFFQGRWGSQAWRLQYLSDLFTLPDYEEGGGYRRDNGAPVHPNGEWN